jgi:hypothetical protein
MSHFKASSFKASSFGDDYCGLCLEDWPCRASLGQIAHECCTSCKPGYLTLELGQPVCCCKQLQEEFDE